jgi:hypothetical protein
MELLNAMVLVEEDEWCSIKGQEFLNSMEAETQTHVKSSLTKHTK